MDLPASPGRTAVPQGSSVLRGSGSSRWGHTFGSGLGFFCTYSIGTKVFPEWAEVPLGSLVLCGSGPSRWGHPWGSGLRACARTLLDRRPS